MFVLRTLGSENIEQYDYRGLVLGWIEARVLQVLLVIAYFAELSAKVLEELMSVLDRPPDLNPVLSFLPRWLQSYGCSEVAFLSTATERFDID